MCRVGVVIVSGRICPMPYRDAIRPRTYIIPKNNLCPSSNSSSNKNLHKYSR